MAGDGAGVVVADPTGAKIVDVLTDDAGVERFAVAQSPFSAHKTQVDSFDRLRVSEPFTIFDFIRRKIAHVGLYYSDSTVGGGTVVTTVSKARTRLHTAGALNDKAIQQTRQYFIYQPGKSQLILSTFNANGKTANVSKKVGQFDVNNGIFLDVASPDVKFVLRSKVSGSVVETTVIQANWSVDKLDGTGASGVTLDWTKTQILVCDYQWLGVGKVRFGFIVGDATIIAHQEFHSNVDTEVWAQTMNLPLRAEIESTAVSDPADMDVFCQSIVTEGGINPQTIPHSVDTGITWIQVGTTLQQLIAIRLKANEQGTVVLPTDIDILAVATSNFRWAVLFNPTVGGTASWSSADVGSVEFDTSRDGSITGGLLLASGYGSKKLDISAVSLGPQVRLGYALDGAADELVVAVQSVVGVENFLSSVRWQEAV